MASLISISRMGGSSWGAEATGSAGVGGGALIGHFRIVTVLPVGRVSHNLHSAIGHRRPVLATDHIPIAAGLVRVIVGGLGVVHRVLEVEGHSRLVMMVLNGINNNSFYDINEKYNKISYLFMVGSGGVISGPRGLGIGDLGGNGGGGEGLGRFVVVVARLGWQVLVGSHIG